MRSVDPDGVTTLHAYFKDDDRERTIRAIDMNHNGHIDYDGTDRIVETTTELVELTPEQREQRKTSSLQSTASSSQHPIPSLIRRATTRVWTTDDDDTTTRIVSVTESTLDGDQSWQSANGRDASSRTEQTGPGSEVRTRIAPDGTRTVSYYENHREVRREAYNADGERTRSTVTEYDAFDRVASITTTDGEDGAVLTSQALTYDPLGRLLRTVDQRGRASENTYNADGSVASTTITAGQETLTTRIEYDAMGRRSVVTRPDGKQVRYACWPTGEIRNVEGAGTYTTSYAHTDQGRLSTLTTAAGETHWQYNAAGQLQRKVYLDSTTVDYEYSPGGKLLQRTTARGIVALCQYNAAGELERVDYSDDNTAPVVYGYNRLGQNTSVVHGNSTTIHQYTADGALFQQSIRGGPLDGVTLEQEFNDHGQRTQYTVRLPHSQTDTATRRTNKLARKTRYLYDLDGILLFDGRWYYQWDAENRLINMHSATHSVRSAHPLELQFAYDPMGVRMCVNLSEGSGAGILQRPDTTVAVEDQFVRVHCLLYVLLAATGCERHTASVETEEHKVYLQVSENQRTLTSLPHPPPRHSAMRRIHRNSKPKWQHSS